MPSAYNKGLNKMPDRHLETLHDIEDFVRGGTFYGTGGGGDFDRGVKILKKHLDMGLSLGWVDVGAIADDEYTMCPFTMGSLATITDEKAAFMRTFEIDESQFGYRRGEHLADAAKALERYTGKKASSYVPIELGGGNAGSCVAAAAMNGVPVVDGDFTGRAIPEITQTLPSIFGKPVLPMSSCDAWHDICFIDSAVNLKMAERIGKQISVAGFLGCDMAGFMMKGSEMKEVVVPGTLTCALDLGKAIRKANEEGHNPVEAIVEYTKGYLVAVGTVSRKDWYDKDGYYWGTHEIVGEGGYAGRTYKIWFKNENHICWRDGKVLVTSPDLISIVDARTGWPFTNNQVQEGDRVAVISTRCNERHRTKEGLEVLAPRAFGYDIDYVPVEEAVKEW